MTTHAVGSGTSFTVDLERSGYKGERSRAFAQELLDRIRALPGVEGEPLGLQPGQKKGVNGRLRPLGLANPWDRRPPGWLEGPVRSIASRGLWQQSQKDRPRERCQPERCRSARIRGEHAPLSWMVGPSGTGGGAGGCPRSATRVWQSKDWLPGIHCKASP